MIHEIFHDFFLHSVLRPLSCYTRGQLPPHYASVFGANFVVIIVDLTYTVPCEKQEPSQFHSMCAFIGLE